MTYGINLVNSAGQGLFSGVEKSMVLVGKGTDTFTAKFQYKSTNYFGDVPPMVFVSFSSLPNSCTAQITRNSTTGEWSVAIFRGYDQTGLTVSWYVFAPLPTNTTVSGYGAAIYNSSGDLTYTSNHRPLQVIHGGVVSAVEDSVITTSNRPAKIGHFVPLLRLENFTGSQITGYNVYITTVSETTSEVKLVSDFYGGGYASPGVIYAEFGYWDSAYLTTIDASLYD